MDYRGTGLLRLVCTTNQFGVFILFFFKHAWYKGQMGYPWEHHDIRDVYGQSATETL
jgi:hypothetical protein